MSVGLSLRSWFIWVRSTPKTGREFKILVIAVILTSLGYWAATGRAMGAEALQCIGLAHRTELSEPYA